MVNVPWILWRRYFRMMLRVRTFRKFHLTERNRTCFVQPFDYRGVFFRVPFAMHMHPTTRRYALRPQEILQSYGRTVQNTEGRALALPRIKYFGLLNSFVGCHRYVRAKRRFQIFYALKHRLDDVDDPKLTTFSFSANIGKRAVVEVHRRPSGGTNVKDLPGIQNSIGIESRFKRAHQADLFIRSRNIQIAFFL